MKARRFINPYNRDYYGGALMLLVGLGVVTQGLSYDVGSLSHMGPGFFPVSLGVILSLVGVGIAFGARRIDSDAKLEEEPLPPEWRGWICIVLSVIAFVILGRYGGLLPASFAIVFISALGDRQNTLLSAMVLAFSVCVICVVVFWWALQLQLPLFTWAS
ncbi:tripartite tricarboxylate transporter TctB family protein [Paraburkholderia xenovorans LB400]|uniref:Tripartite tricarboxylate transporter(TTT) family, TctB (4TM) subunit n=1 Tax=Paraburkholderia xenovorans (strain LB400) TaxID=266265 RepID=Q13GA1_PARXL|nr:tripartite tricarboxylate transporter TctB family protein [Paraburkholderia xenovorans]ABE36888.1 putative tripartite tricarboxylate transporter(TTT) family, TctB (4TM) subunit [Paraburkholderia xenovorans LB400]AIP34990.1 tripartite tricarboxylate transporter TctB family protein [Paraburkholderia xenovorans LB400]